ncbi:MAG: GNAT family N-acetyltransferase [Chloroflexi bacterium]|nr:GNAT family N-acetyltransferase [Chloroflexota bacterium]
MKKKNSFIFSKGIDADAADLISVILQGLHFSPDIVEEFVREKFGPGSFRIVKINNKTAGCLAVMEMGQWFGGRQVPAAGIIAVATVPEHRRKGAASFLLKNTLEELKERDYPISILFPATLPVYRKAGYERAGSRITYEVNASDIGLFEREAEMLPACPEDEPEFRSLYLHRAKLTNGNLERHPLLWKKVVTPRDGRPYIYLVRENGVNTGYVIYTQGSQHTPVDILDMCILTPGAGKRILTFFADHSSMISTVTWTGGPNDVLHHLLPELNARISSGGDSNIDWMLRIVDVKGALEARGYPEILNSTIHLEVTDDVLPWNNGKYRLEISGGRGTVKKGGKGGKGGVRIDVRGLAPLYSSHLTAHELKTLGLADGADKELAEAGLIFSGPRPWMPDIF